MGPSVRIISLVITERMHGSLYALLILSFAALCMGQISGSNQHVSKLSAYCYYYKTASVNNNNNAMMNVSSDNIYAYGSIYVSPTLAINSDSTLLGRCRPDNPGTLHHDCSTSDDNNFSDTSTNFVYVLACLECHYYLGDCIFDDFAGELPAPTTGSGTLTCSLCN